MAAQKLSVTMTRTIDAIRAGGGEAHPERGGWWRSSPTGQRLQIPTDYRRLAKDGHGWHPNHHVACSARTAGQTQRPRQPRSSGVPSGGM